jgi:hypothetical protein
MNAYADGCVDRPESGCTGRACKIADTIHQQQSSPSDGGHWNCPPPAHDQAENEDGGNQS